jgi:nucleoside-diphosphate-sugar epimerase
MSSKVLVTGSRGYVGTATKELLEDYGYEVVEIDRKINKDTRLIFKHIKPNTLSYIIHLSAKSLFKIL